MLSVKMRYRRDHRRLPDKFGIVSDVAVGELKLGFIRRGEL